MNTNIVIITTKDNSKSVDQTKHIDTSNTVIKTHLELKDVDNVEKTAREICPVRDKRNFEWMG